MYRMRRSFASRLLSGVFRIVNKVIAWHRLPPYLSSFNLLSFREELREKNLHSTSEIPADPAKLPVIDARPESRAAHAVGRSSDGTYNDPNDPRMGCTFARFGRNFPLEKVYPEPLPGLLEPSPRLVSRELLARRVDPQGKDVVVEATTLNLLAAAWIQFMTHDWFHHGDGLRDRKFPIPLPEGDDWTDVNGERKLEIRATPPDPTRVHGDKGYPSAWLAGDNTPRPPDGPPTYRNHGSHWWDGSQIYGENEEVLRRLRCPDTDDDGRDTRGELKLTDTRQLLTDPESHLVVTGFADNWWIGLTILHTLFSQEHNAIAAAIRQENPYWSGDQIFRVARLVNTALLAKIHTVEWTPGILGHPALQISMNANWWGLVGEHFTRSFGRISDNEAFGGIPGSPVDHHSAPYSLTEEFVSVYRMHSLLPETIKLHRVSDGGFDREVAFEEVLGRAAQALLSDVVDETTERHLKGGKSADKPLTLADVCYSFGIAHPGAITFQNYPRFLRNMKRYKADGVTVDQIIDLASIDILRDRERGVPRYNDFREMLRLPRARTFSDITSNSAWAAEISKVYDGDIDRVDVVVGMMAEDLPRGFGFSDTAFRIFILMASRRLKSDRFFTTDYTPEVYTQRGLDWINENTMVTVLIRHFPQLQPVLRQMPNAFAPWPRIEDVLLPAAAKSS